MITSKQIIKLLDEALKQFGTYQFYDKGPDEVMNTDPITDELRKLTADKAGKILNEVKKNAKEGGESLVEYLVCIMDDQPDEWFETVLEMTGVDY